MVQLKIKRLYNIIGVGILSIFSEHEGNLPHLFHINFPPDDYRLITTICTDTLFSTFTAISKALTIFF
jgi:hypothetical protein